MIVVLIVNTYSISPFAEQNNVTEGILAGCFSLRSSCKVLTKAVYKILQESMLLIFSFVKLNSNNGNYFVEFYTWIKQESKVNVVISAQKLLYLLTNVSYCVIKGFNFQYEEFQFPNRVFIISCGIESMRDLLRGG